MNVRRRFSVALAGLFMMNAPTSFAQTVPATPLPSPSEPARLSMDAGPAGASLNQKIADTIAFHLRQNQQLHHYRVEILFQDGLVELTGHVADQSQREEVLRVVHGLAGVERVRDRLEIRSVPLLRPAQAVAQAPAAEPGPAPRPAPPGVGVAPVEPTPIFQAPPGPPQAAQSPLPPPRMPPYAWPTYAPYNNYSRVAYPTLYPYQSWPFIGPNYPFPKIPPGWRSISLTWQDGSWWYGKNASSHDWWRIRYW